jgi:osmoprotectant transport system substrate-binding protein
MLRKSKRTMHMITVFVLFMMVLTSCNLLPGSNGVTVRVASKDFTEQFILGEMYALVLEDAGFTVERRMNLGGTPVAQQALLSDEIDVYPEYTGTGLLTVLGLPVESDPQVVYDTVSREYLSQFNLVWLEPAPMNNTQALAMTRERANQLGIRTISDMVANASQLTMAGPPEFQEREDGLPGLRQVYGDFELAAYQAIDRWTALPGTGAGPGGCGGRFRNRWGNRCL